MASNPPKDAQQDDLEGGKLSQTVLPKVGRADDESKGNLVPFELIGPIIESKFLQLKAEMERDFGDKLKQIDNLPTKWELMAGGASAIIVTLALLFTMLSYFGDRQDNAVDRSATLSTAISEINSSVEDLKDEQDKREQSGAAVQPPPRSNDRP